MKKISTFFLILVSVGLMSGCGSASSTSPAQANQPDWVDETPPDDVLWGIGSAKQSNPAMSRSTAEARGRTAIARALNTNVQAMFTDYNRDAGTTGAQANVSLQEDVSRQVTSMQLNGAKINKSWTAPDGTVWVRVEFSKADAKASVSAIFDSEAAQYAEFKADQALAMLDTQLGKKEKPLVTKEEETTDATGSGGSASAQSQPVRTGGAEPGWVSAPYSVYAEKVYVAASGTGSTRDQAEKKALANLIAIFGQSIQADLKIVTNYSEAISKGSVQFSSENTSIQDAIKTSSAMDSLIGAEIKDVWSNKNIYYAVAVLERAKASTLYTDMISSSQRIITDLTTMSDADKYTLEGYSRYQLAATIADVNRVYANVLTVLGNNSGIVPGNLKKGDDYRLEAVNITKNIPIGVVVVGNDQSDRIKGAFAAVLNKQGFRSGGTNSRYVLNVRVVLSEVQLQNQQNKFARYEVDAKLTDTSDNSVLLPFNINGREGHTTLSEAQNRAIAGAEKKINDTYTKQLADYLASLLPKPKS